jgi:G3E family GTPase
MKIVVGRWPVDSRTPLLVVTGAADAVGRVGAALLQPGTVLVEHDLTLVNEGVVRRRISTAEEVAETMLELAHGCVSCTMRLDLLPLLRVLARRADVSRIVLLLDPAMQADGVCHAIDTVVVDAPGLVRGTAGRDVSVHAVIGALDARTWLADACADETVGERAGTADDERTVAQVAVGQAEIADALVVFGDPDPLDAAALHAVLARLCPCAPTLWAGGLDDPIGVSALLAAVPPTARRGRAVNPHASLLHGAPPLESDAGVVWVEFVADRPFHPQRLHEAVDVLLDGVVTARGRLWLATQHDSVLWLESAGGGLQVYRADRWLAAMTPQEQSADPARLAMAGLHWHPEYGDRHNSLVALSYSADPSAICRALQWALVTDDELADPDAWTSWPDPFGDWHEDPCGTAESPHTPHAGEDRSQR